MNANKSHVASGMAIVAGPLLEWMIVALSQLILRLSTLNLKSSITTKASTTIRTTKITNKMIHHKIMTIEMKE